MAFKNKFTKPVPQNTEQQFIEQDIKIYRGKAFFYDEKTVVVGEEKIQADIFVVAAGAKPVELPIEGSELLKTSAEFLELEELPKRIVFVGGGYIAFEFAHIANAAGSEVTIIQRSQPLKNFDEDMVNVLVDATRARGIEVVTGSEVKSVKKQQNFVVSTDKQAYVADLVVHAAGRVPDTDELELKRGNVETEKKGILVEPTMRSSSNNRVYAVGDCNSNYPLTPVAEKEADVAAYNIINNGDLEADYTGVPSVVFTIPELAGVGVRSKSSDEEEVIFRDRSQWFTSAQSNEEYAASKVIIDKHGHILGAHILGKNAEEVINIFALAIRFGLTRDQLREALYTYPSVSHDIRYML